MIKTAEELKQQAIKIKLHRWTVNICSMCGYPCGYIFRDNWEKLPYNTKILSDGTVARVGTIAHDINRRFTGTILKTISDDIGFNRVGPSSNDIILSTPNTERGWGWNASYSPTKFALYVYVSELRKATPEERKQYYKDLQNL